MAGEILGLTRTVVPDDTRRDVEREPDKVKSRFIFQHNVTTISNTRKCRDSVFRDPQAVAHAPQTK